MWGVISTWDFSLQTVQKTSRLLEEGESAMTSAIEGVKLVESDPTVTSVGKGGFLNRSGELELDAAVMDGKTLKFGAVMSVKGFEHPVDIARAVMEQTPHVILAGAGAENFAREIGIEEAGTEALITEFARAEWKKQTENGHDTIGAVALDRHGDLASVVSTSGANMKLPGRVGDSPIIGSGYYCENGVGGAAATGLGEDIMKTCLCFRCVELMRTGLSPTEAAEACVKSAHETLVRTLGKAGNMALVCMNHKGEYGAACNHKDFAFAVAAQGVAPQIVSVRSVLEA